MFQKRLLSQPKWSSYNTLMAITIKTSFDDKSRQFESPFTEANMKLNILESPFFEEYIKDRNFQEIQEELFLEHNFG